MNESLFSLCVEKCCYLYQLQLWLVHGEYIYTYIYIYIYYITFVNVTRLCRYYFYSTLSVSRLASWFLHIILLLPNFSLVQSLDCYSWLLILVLKLNRNVLQGFSLSMSWTSILKNFPCFTQENLDVTSLRPESLFVLNLLAPLWVNLNENSIEN